MKRLRIAYRAPVAGALVLGLAAAAGCSPRAGSSSGAPDASVSFAQSNLVTNPATWNSLYGSWPALRYDHGMVYDSDLKRIVVFGGRGAVSGPHFGDLWEWDSAKGSWNQRTPGGRTPYDRSQPAMFYDTVRKKTVMFSGWQPGAGFYHPDQWEWDGAAQTWTERQLTTQPSARFGAAVVWDSARGKAVLFGGFDEATGRRNDTWEWDGTAWTDRTPAGASPTPRHSALMVFDSMRNKTVLYSGNSGNGVATAGTWVDETWEWDGTAGTWTRITAPAITSTQWSSGYTNMVYDPVLNKIVLYYYYNYVWTYTAGTGATGTWADAPMQTKIDSSLPGYYNPGMVYDSNKQAVVVFGGQSSGRSLWQLTTTDFNWTNRSAPANGPIQRQYPSMAVNGKTGKLIVFGGHSSVDNAYKNDIWEWSGTDDKLTNQTTGGTKPDPRNQAGLVYDSTRDRFLLFGGYGTGAYDDLWAWAPGTREWTQISLTGSRPSARYGHWMFYDPGRDKVYVFGQNQGSYVNWEYDPALNTWKDRTVTSPPAGVSRSYFDVAFDSNRGKIILFGGYYNSVYNTDIWEWDTTTGVWAQLTPTMGTAVPDGRYYPTVAYDSIRRVLLLVGGYKQITGATGPANDSWEWDANLLRWTETTPTGAKPAPRYQHLMVFNPVRGTTYLFGGTVPDDTTYGPSEFWEYLPNAAARPIGAGCSPAMASACASGNCVDGVCCTQTAAQCAGTCKSCNVAGMAGTCLSVPAGLPDDTCPSDQACDTAQQCKRRLGQACNMFSECASGNCVDGVCCDTACNDKCKQCNLASKRGTCSFVPSGEEDPVGVPACVSEPAQGRQCDGAGNCNNSPKPVGRTCTAGGQCATGYCIDGYCCNSGCAQTCYRCDKAGALGTCSPRAAGEQDQSATTPCDQTTQTCNGSGTCVTNKKPNGVTCQAASECGSNNCVDQILLQRRVRGHLPVVRGDGLARHVRQRAGGRAGLQRHHAVQRHRAVLRRERHLPVGPQAERQHLREQRRMRREQVRGRRLLQHHLHRGLLHLQPAGWHARRVRRSADRDEGCLHGQRLLRRHAQVHDRQEAERRGVHGRPRVRVERLRRWHLLRERVPGQVPDLQERDGQLRAGRGRHGPAHGLRGRRDVHRHLQRPGDLPLGSPGDFVRGGRLPADDGHHHGRGNLRRRGALQRGEDHGLQGLPLLHGRAGDGSVREGLLARSPVRARLLLREHERRRYRGRRARWGRGLGLSAGLRSRTRVQSQRAMRVRVVQRRRLLQHQLRQVRHLQPCRDAGYLRADRGRNRSRGRVHGQRQRSDRPVQGVLQRPGALHLSGGGHDLRHLQDLQRRRPVQPEAGR